MLLPETARRLYLRGFLDSGFRGIDRRRVLGPQRQRFRSFIVEFRPSFGTSSLRAQILSCPARIAKGTDMGTSLTRSDRAAALAFFSGAALFLAACSGGDDEADPSYVTTTSGVVHGSAAGDQRAFLGIPYAAPPVGSLRWKPPQPAPAWAAVRESTQLASACSQPITDAAGRPAILGAEDCLYLNVYAPKSAAGTLPVLVFLHGGAFRNGAGSDYDAGEFSRKGKVVVVTVNYRLGVFGFLAHPALAAESADGTSGQYGLLDQRFALEWVRSNIAAFGGDPANVTLAGHSSGGYAVCNHLASPRAAGLFHKAILQSAACTSASASLPQASAEAAGVQFAQGLGCASDTPSCLRGLQADALVLAPPTERVGGGLGWAPALGGVTLPRSAAAAIRAGDFHQVPVLLGTTREEYRVFVAIQEFAQGSAISPAQYTGFVNGAFGGGAAAVLETYPLAAYPAPSLAQAALLTDFAFACPVQSTAFAISARVRTYAYEFDDPSAPTQVPAPFTPQRSFHGAELPYLFKQPLSPYGFGPVAPLSAAQQVLADQMIAYWSNFATVGDPNGAGLPNWPRFTAADPARQIFMPQGAVSARTFASDHRCSFWTGFGV